ncbi:uncharacterized protein [Nicotiana sylvestris]|uniref:Uncharacterized protein LOC104213113 n=1 Tax=Nicotiana sylvestris TaxID=4096 RepID=A0A1U7VG72_NICSY|nr:PREDICTED: uncharacterized protein LOC104213113 [Nicotiana sylvestris]
MAKDKVGSFGTEASRSNKRLAEKKQVSNSKLIFDEIFVRIPGSPSKFILGPCFKTMLPPELSPRYPLAEGEKLLLHCVQPDSFKGKTLRSWPHVSRTWIDWVDRVEKAKWEVWKSADIYDAIQLSKIDIPKDKNLIYAALCYWSISTNSFHFRFGMMGPTILDIVSLTGLRPHGEEVSVPLAIAESTCDFPKYGKIKECLTYCKFLDVSMGAMSVTEEEHISFLVMWLCRYLLCNSSITMIEQCTKLAFVLAMGKKLALAPFVLSNLYHGCHDIVTGKFDDATGPFWILQLWLQSYFPEHQPSTSDNGNAPTYGFPLAEGVLRPKTFNHYFVFFHTCSYRPASQFTPFSSRKFGPEWFKRSLDPYFQKLNRTELKDIWASYLIARDIPYSIVLDESSKWKCGVEHYSPNQFARQFGMKQAVPLHRSANDFSIRREEDNVEETESRFSQLKRKFSFVPFNINPSSRTFFDSWWSTYIKNRDKTAIDVLRKISPCDMPLSPSDRQEVAAPKSIGIKGDSQSAGKFGQNMKRNYKGGNIPSQSFVQQDEYRQQRNSYEAAEKISTRGISCKKMKISAMETPLPGTTSTSCNPADEDRNMADMHVSGDDTSISTSSSTAENEGKKCKVSPLLAKTRSKTSDIIEPLDCPVKFDNLDDFFAGVSGQIKRARSISFSTGQSSSIYDKISATQKSTPSVEMLATAKNDIDRLLHMPSQDLLLPENCSTLSAALSIYAESPDLSVERALSLEKLKENLPHISSTWRRAKKDKEDYYKNAAKKVVIVDELTKGQELYTNLKDYDDKLERTMDSIRNQMSKLKARLKDAKTKRKAIQEQKLSLARKSFEKSTTLDEMEAEFSLLEEMKDLADSDIARVEESLKVFKSKITGSPV